MELNEADRLLALAEAGYPEARDAATREDRARVWAYALQDVPADIALMALLSWMSQENRAPTVADVRGRVQSLYYEADGLLAMDSDDPLTPEERQRAEYIVDCTWRLRGDRRPGLKLRSMIRDGSDKLQLLTGCNQLQSVAISCN